MKANWDSVVEKILIHSNEKELSVLMALLLTEDERAAIAGRMKVFQLLLDSELSQRQIASEYQVSIATITRCSNYLKNMSTEHRERVRQILCHQSL
ncbi:trp operon repressor [Shewanella gelidii]|uniref:Trp operon repressor homolog n=1 Tax=Shewanella gelidii TaxID=1642821 RepID=A0A917JJL3_9GAMM|nr:trp operon repressor [Shewanella gelidii]MCL1096642.1 trp operon repressor [Shewanella gelidii]GGI69099.1 Trp operon repressor [Shewanella gelidii]